MHLRSQVYTVWRFVGTGVALAIAVLSCAHALSSAGVRKSPEVSVKIWPANGLALETVAYRSFVKNIREPMGGSQLSEARDLASRTDDDRKITALREDMQRSAVASSAAINALKYEPLLPKAHAILALSESDPVRQARVIALAYRLNRRELSLQALVLQSRAETGDYAGTIATLDQILRVHPQRRTVFFRILTDALRQRSTMSRFRDLLAKPLPWRDAFLMHAVNDPIAARNLAMIRQDADFDNPDFDRALIASLARNGDLGASALIYSLVNKSTSQSASLSWSSDYPPFDWSFTNKAGLRGQITKDGRNLEFAIDPGNGGVLASRLIELPDGSLSISVRHQLDGGAAPDDLKLTLTCFGKQEAFFEASFKGGRERFDIPERPNCDYSVLAFSGRAWTASSALNGTINEVLVTTR